MGLNEGVGVGWWIRRVWIFMLSMRKCIASYDHSDVFLGAWCGVLGIPEIFI